jgi:hypothetical protein
VNAFLSPSLANKANLVCPLLADTGPPIDNVGFRPKADLRLMPRKSTCSSSWLGLVLMLAGTLVFGAEADLRLRVDEQVDIFWIDNDRILFLGFPTEILPRISAGTLTWADMSAAGRAVRSFNVRTGAIVEHAISTSGGFCYSDGDIIYSRYRRDGRAHYVSRSVDSDPKVSELDNFITRCGQKPYFAPWKGAYFTYTVGFRGSVPNSALWTYASGKTERVYVPTGPWDRFTRTSARFEPARCGLVVNITYQMGELLFVRADLSVEPPWWNLFAWLRSPELLAPGRVWRHAVSPDGRKLAIVSGATAIPNTNPSSLRILELCKDPG